HRALLRGVDDLDAAVARPARLVRLGADRALLAVADHRQLAGGTAVGLQRRGHRVGTALAEAEVVLAAATLVGMAFQGDAGRGTVAQVLGVAGPGRLDLRLDAVAVEVAVNDALAQARVTVQVLRGVGAGDLGRAGVGRAGRRRRIRGFRPGGLALAAGEHGNGQQGQHQDAYCGVHLVDPFNA